jgi:hypothetical protein
MGGVGSGTWYRWKKRKTLEECHVLNVRDLKNQDLLRQGFTGSLSWSRGGKTTGSVSFRYDEPWLILSYTYVDRDVSQSNHTESILVEWTPCNYGGSRPWFGCPACGRRVVALALHRTRFLCRQCHKLPYKSQMEAQIDRVIRRARKIRKRVGASSDELPEPLWDRPKGMREKTFVRYAAEYAEILDEFDTYVRTRFGL